MYKGSTFVYVVLNLFSKIMLFTSYIFTSENIPVSLIESSQTDRADLPLALLILSQNPISSHQKVQFHEALSSEVTLQIRFGKSPRS